MGKNWGLDALNNSLIELEIGKDDFLFIHSNLGVLGDGISAESLLKYLCDFVGASGALFLPAFSYSFGVERVFEPKDVSNFESMGTLPRVAFEQGFVRTFDPMFSVLSSPGHGADVASRPYRNTSFGPGSFFSHLVDRNVKILNLGTGAGSTLLHELEFRLGVKYRFEKRFEFLSSGELTPKPWFSYVRDLTSDSTEASFKKLNSVIKNEKFYRSTVLGRGRVSSYKTLDMLFFLEKTLEREPNFLTVANSNT